jgi:hypothetical protein
MRWSAGYWLFLESLYGENWKDNNGIPGISPARFRRNS